MTLSVSIIVPCRDEERFISRCLESILATDYPLDKLEILVVDGMSTDRTTAIVEELARDNACIRLLKNPALITPAALNTGIRNARGDIIVRMDAHTLYPSSYVSSVVRWLEESGADNVGGVWITMAADDSPKARAIAAGLSHRFGVGNCHFRVGAKEPRWVDTVPFTVITRRCSRESICWQS